MKYPYIANNNLLFYAPNIATIIGDENNANSHGFKVVANECDYANITADYLRNTYGKVESKEHAEFIVRLADNAGFYADSYHKDFKWFCFYGKNLFFFNEKSVARDYGEKLITIPMPPKEPKPKEWPQVGDDVLTASKLKGNVVFINGDKAWIEYREKLDGNQVDLVVMTDSLSKPKTPEEELAANIANAADSDDIHSAHEMIAKAIINGEIKGLTYKP